MEDASKGIDYLRNLYASSSLNMRPKTSLCKIDRLKMFAKSLGLPRPRPSPEQRSPNNAIQSNVDPQPRKIETLNQALKEAMLRELRR